MKRAFLIPLGLVALLATAAASAAPATFIFNTSAFDFTNSALTEGYIGFSMVGGQIQVALSSAGSISGIPGIEVAVPDSSTNPDGATVYPTLGYLSDINVVTNGGQDTGLTVTHNGASLNAVTSAYIDAFTKMGFKTSLTDTVGQDVLVYTFSKGGLELRAVFHRTGPDVTAHLSGAAAV